MQFVTGAITSCIGFGGVGVLLGGPLAARNANEAQQAIALGVVLIVGALVLTPLCHWLLLLLFRTTQSRQPFATALRTTGATLAVLLIAGLFALGLG